MRWTGSVTQLVGLLVESHGPNVAVNDFCELETAGGRRIRAQVIGFRNGRVLSMPLEEIDGLQLGDLVAARGEEARVPVSPGLLGRVIDGFGLPMDDGPPIDGQAQYSLYGVPVNPDRKSTRLNSSHLGISYAVFWLKKGDSFQRDAEIQQMPGQRNFFRRGQLDGGCWRVNVECFRRPSENFFKPRGGPLKIPLFLAPAR